MKFTRLRLSGFKSFVEPTELFIESGLTAVVGPNGCGKSNLFDALRWVMGETRPTSIRGSEMDDVIFAGSAGRPSRNMAEVTLFIDNADRSANGAYNEYDTLEISRLIEREAGSVYRINGRDVRQRDVQLFFADASSGATSTAFVRQGQIGQLISQKPLARRAILEEAAGIGGLHQRRHEAELRLRAAETNLGRLDDIIREIEGQLASLKRQARQAARYRGLSGHIRKAESLAHYLRWTAALSRAAAAADELTAASASVEFCTRHAAEASTVQAGVASELPPLRHAEAERSAALHRLIVAREALDTEEVRARETAQRLRQRIGETQDDISRDQTLDGDAQAALATLSEEAQRLEDAIENSGEELDEAQMQTASSAQALNEIERLLEELTSTLAEWNARKASSLRARDMAAGLAETTAAQLELAQARLDRALADATDTPDARRATAIAQEARHAADALRTVASEARDAFASAEQRETEARDPLEEAEREWQRLSAEAKALGDLLRPEGQDLFPPLVDAVRVRPGYEAALAATLGDDLQAPLDEASPHHWRDLGEFGDEAVLPQGAKPLAEFVDGPPALSRRLAMTGIVFPDQGRALQSQLRPGQRLVSPRGDLWRWDGYSASADAPSAAAVRLAQRNRIAALDAEIEQARLRRAETFNTYTTAKNAANAAREATRAFENDERSAQSALSSAQDNATAAARAAAERASALASLESEIRRLSQAHDAASEAARNAEKEIAELGAGVTLSHDVATSRGAAAEARTAASDARAKFEGLKREGENRQRRLVAIGEEQTRWEERRQAACGHIQELERRREDLRAELALAEAIPAAIGGKRNVLLDAIAMADTARQHAADGRAHAEVRLAGADKAAKAADYALSAAREDRARAQALGEAAQSRLSELSDRVRDELECLPEELSQRAEIKDDEELPTLDHAEKRVERLKQEREQLGGVNLRAEEEAAEHETRLQTLVTDRDDLVGAIERLRRGIQSLNKEGRERLLASFEKVNANFHVLFGKLFEGGEARLALTESDDPLEAGLEIFARPPGKRLQSLGLLSGGEQALTAMSLILAVFLVNPAPVCVLDEVDAPLDDANVERFCNLLDEMTRLTDTRFLVITHHALTMSRMHRLFGVTMAERGVSQLVSVSLAEAEKVAAE